MALHAKLLKHNILRVSKLKKLSHTTQAIERHYDRQAALTVTQMKISSTDDRKENDLSKQEAGLLSLPAQVSSLYLLEGPPPSGQQSLALGLQELLALPPQQTGMMGKGSYPDMLCWAARPALDTVTSQKLLDKERSLTAAVFPQDFLPLVVKQVSYTTDDILACPVGQQVNSTTDDILAYPVGQDGQLDPGAAVSDSDTSLLSQLHSACWDSVVMDTSCHNSKDIDPSVAKNCSLSESNTRHFRRHSVCVSDPASSAVGATDCNTVRCGLESQWQSSHTVQCSMETSHTVHCTAGSQQPAGGEGQGPNLDQLKRVETYFIDTLPSFFKTRMDYQVYHPNIVLENNFWGKNEVTVGLNQYAMQMMKLRALTHLKFAHVHMEVVSSACIPEEGVVRMEWRIVGISQLKALRFWKYTAWNYNKTFKEDAEWIGGVSTLHVNKDGVVTKHRIDRVTPDEGQAVKQMSLAAKLALLLGLTSPKPGLSDFSSLLCRR